jgi:succinyl-CoA synthetase beta subunit
LNKQTGIESSPLELEAQKRGLAYVKLDGNIGVIGNGAGLVMATLDAINLLGGNPANFLDIGGGASPDVIATSLSLVYSDPGVNVVFINILSGITRCDDIAKGILEVKRQSGFLKPLVVRLAGTKEEEGKRMLKEVGIHVFANRDKAVKRAVEIARTGG